MAQKAAGTRGGKLKIVLGGLLLLGVAMQLIPPFLDHTNPPVKAEPPWDSPRTRETFFRVCGDCHSNETVWPWYSSIAPGSWLIERDVKVGRSEFNVSEWGRAHNPGEDAAIMVEKGEMPLAPYLLLHPEARLSDAEKAEFMKGLEATFSEDSGE
jgi:mono/diheme cytochrome c family protein